MRLLSHGEVRVLTYLMQCNRWISVFLFTSLCRMTLKEYGYKSYSLFKSGRLTPNPIPDLSVFAMRLLRYLVEEYITLFKLIF